MTKKLFTKGASVKLQLYLWETTQKLKRFDKLTDLNFFEESLYNVVKSCCQK